MFITAVGTSFLFKLYNLINIVKDGGMKSVYYDTSITDSCSWILNGLFSGFFRQPVDICGDESGIAMDIHLQTLHEVTE